MNKTNQTTVLTRRKQKLSALLLIGIFLILSLSNQIIPAAATHTPEQPDGTHIFEIEYVAAYIADDHDTAWEDGSYEDHPGEWYFKLSGGGSEESSRGIPVNTGDTVSLGLSLSWELEEPDATFSFTASEHDYYTLQTVVSYEVVEYHCHEYEYTYSHLHKLPWPWFPFFILIPDSHTYMACGTVWHPHVEENVDRYFTFNYGVEQDYVSSDEITLDPGLPTNTWHPIAIVIGDVTHLLRYRLYTPYYGNPNTEGGSGQIVFEGDEVFFDASDSIGSTHYYSGIVSLWHMNEYSGTTMSDETPNRNDGSVHGAIFQPTPDLFQDYGFGLYFDGTDDFVEVPHSPDFNFDNGFSVSSWINLRDRSSGGIIGQWGYGGSGGDVFMLSVDDGYLRGTLPIPGLYHLYSNVQIPLNMWTQVAMTYDGMELRLYIDGVLVAQGNIVVNLPAIRRSLKLGLEDIFFGQKNYLYGMIDETAIWDKALTSQEILAQSVRTEHTLGPSFAAEIIEFSWDFDGDSIYDYTETPANAPDGIFDGKTSFVYLDDGVYSVYIKAVDEYGETDIDMISITVYNNDNTPKGTDVEISDTDAGVTMMFSEITDGGSTTITVNDEGPLLSTESQLHLGLYYEFTTTASYTGPITICINYNEVGLTGRREADLKLMHYNGKIWVDITTSLDTENNIICGVTNQLSSFGLMYDSTPPEIISISGPLDPVAIDSDYEITGIFTDLDDSDTHTAIWDWGDGIHSTGTIDQTTNTVTGFHKYLEPGVYTITLTVVDSFDERGTATWSQNSVIYDPWVVLLDWLLEIIEDNLGTSLEDKIEDVIAKVETAYEEFMKDPPDYQATIGNLEGAVGDLEAVVKDGLLNPAEGTDLMDLITAISQQLAENAIINAIAYEGDQDTFDEALEYFIDGFILRVQEKFKDAINKYKDALAKAESMLP